MGYGVPDVYYQPEAFGLVPVAEIDYSDGCYQFDIRAVWKHTETGRLYTARDSGCSCPSPFEEFTKLELLDEVDMYVLENEVSDESGYEYSDVNAHEAARFIQLVRDEL